jgi:hypothetical protein
MAHFTRNETLSNPNNKMDLNVSGNNNVIQLINRNEKKDKIIIPSEDATNTEGKSASTNNSSSIPRPPINFSTIYDKPYQVPFSQVSPQVRPSLRNQSIRPLTLGQSHENYLHDNIDVAPVIQDFSRSYMHTPELDTASLPQRETGNISPLTYFSEDYPVSMNSEMYNDFLPNSPISSVDGNHSRASSLVYDSFNSKSFGDSMEASGRKNPMYFVGTPHSVNSHHSSRQSSQIPLQDFLTNTPESSISSRPHSLNYYLGRDGEEEQFVEEPPEEPKKYVKQKPKSKDGVKYVYKYPHGNTFYVRHQSPEIRKKVKKYKKIPPPQRPHPTDFGLPIPDDHSIFTKSKGDY